MQRFGDLELSSAMFGAVSSTNLILRKVGIAGLANVFYKTTEIARFTPRVSSQGVPPSRGHYILRLIDADCTR